MRRWTCTSYDLCALRDEGRYRSDAEHACTRQVGVDSSLGFRTPVGDFPAFDIQPNRNSAVTQDGVVSDIPTLDEMRVLDPVEEIPVRLLAADRLGRLAGTEPWRRIRIVEMAAPP